MAYDEQLLERVRAVLAPHELEEKRMFGSRAFMLDGNIACGVREDALFVRVGPDDYERALNEPHVDTFPPSSTEYRPMKGFVTVAPEGIPEDEDLVGWCDAGLAFATTLPPKPGKG